MPEQPYNTNCFKMCIKAILPLIFSLLFTISIRVNADNAAAAQKLGEVIQAL
jgi:hypothetical protein